ncbi:hypothetical protein GCM10012287_01300 [Streptomyces daqingensis]|uniref:Uncharacterized protein n=1 Tax=Streptomyces daqingensis TaxID=1472640 RepID=A0ABQ2LRR3_9ACTN|nr:hypothetical protein GCM10012287_01300 [Streptomyces daqingensis]
MHERGTLPQARKAEDRRFEQHVLARGPSAVAPALVHCSLPSRVRASAKAAAGWFPPAVAGRPGRPPLGSSRCGPSEVCSMHGTHGHSRPFPAAGDEDLPAGLPRTTLRGSQGPALREPSGAGRSYASVGNGHPLAGDSLPRQRQEGLPTWQNSSTRR